MFSDWFKKIKSKLIVLTYPRGYICDSLNLAKEACSTTRRVEQKNELACIKCIKY